MLVWKEDTSEKDSLEELMDCLCTAPPPSTSLTRIHCSALCTANCTMHYGCTVPGSSMHFTYKGLQSNSRRPLLFSAFQLSSFWHLAQMHLLRCLGAVEGVFEKMVFGICKVRCIPSEQLLPVGLRCIHKNASTKKCIHLFQKVKLALPCASNCFTYLSYLIFHIGL